VKEERWKGLIYYDHLEECSLKLANTDGNKYVRFISQELIRA
jgi:hypothetical protein